MDPEGERLRDRFRGALLGTLCGDALGAAVEGWRPREAGVALADPAAVLRRGGGRWTILIPSKNGRIESSMWMRDVQIHAFKD